MFSTIQKKILPEMPINKGFAHFIHIKVPILAILCPFYSFFKIDLKAIN